MNFINSIMILAIAVSCQDQSKTSVKQGIAEVNGTQLYYEMAGKGQPIVLIHGNGVDSRQWNDQFMALASNFQVVRYDVRGFGKSAMPVLEEKYSHHGDLKALLDYLDIKKAHICGSTDFCLAWPEYYLSLISAGPWVFGYHSPAAKDLYSVMDSVGKVFKKDGAKAAMEHWIGNTVFSNSFQDAKTR
ncbi:MAG: alpha/beta hydrolase, partial [Bacteroidales bacterium]